MGEKMDAISLITGIVIGILGGAVIVLMFRKSNQPVAATQPTIDVKLIENAVKAAASDALKTNREETVKLAKDQIDPIVKDATTKIEQTKTGIGSTIESLNGYLQSIGNALSTIETERIRSYSSLDQKLKDLIINEKELRDSANQLSSAIRNPQAKGSWGEITLKRIAELSGMLEYCDFETQTIITVDGKERRPDMVVKLPSNRVIIVDSKAPTSSYLSAIEAKTPEESAQRMKDHANTIKNYANQLSGKEYWKGYNKIYNNSLELVVMYIPGESFLYAALQEDRNLVDRAMESNVIIATPTILLSLLKAIARGWNERKVEENAKRIIEAGRELYERLRKIGGDIEAMGEGIEKSVKSYNTFVGSYESRVLVSARKLAELGPGEGNEIQSVEGIESQIRKLKVHEDQDSVK